MAEFVDISVPGQPARRLEHRGSHADRGVIDQIFGAQDYSLDRFTRGGEIRDLYVRLTDSGARPLVLDAGANIGASALFFCLTYPRAHVLALEPERANFELLRRNCGGLDVEALCAGIAATAGVASLLDPGLGEWGYRTVREAGARSGVPLYAASDLVSMKTREGFEPFIAKIDIEGGESELFSCATGWVDAFPLLIIELHDQMLPGQANSQNFLKCMAKRDRDFVYSGENVFSFRNG